MYRNEETTQTTYAKEIALLIDRLPEGEAECAILRRVWKILIRFVTKA